MLSLYGQHQKSAFQTLGLGKAKEVVLVFNDEIEVQKWDGDQIMVEATISTNTEKEVVLDYYVRNGYYEVVTYSVQNKLTLTTKKWRNELIVKGEEPQFKIRYKILIPKQVRVTQKKTLKNGTVAETNF